MHIGPIIRAMKHNRTRVVLIVLEIALTLAIVTNCINVILAERAKMQQKSGFDDDNIVWLKIRPFSPEFKDDAFIDNIIDQDVRTIESVPGVRAAASTNFQLWEGGGSSSQVYPLADPKVTPAPTQIYYGTKDLIKTLGATIIEGREFRDGDHGVGHVVDPADKAIISKTVADALFPDGHAVGKIIQQGEPGNPFEEPITVIGVIGEFFNPFGRPTNPSMESNRGLFLPARVGGFNGGMRYLIRCEPGQMKPVMAEVEKRLTAQNAGRVFEFMTTPEKKARWFSSGKIVVTTMSCIIVALVAVTALGLLGLTSLAVAERKKQIGTRRALGATRGDILRYFLLENSLVTAVGLLLGIAGAYALNFMLVSHVSDVKLDWQLVAGGVVLLWINGIIATVPPAIRAMMVSPSIATRSV
ncbi:MAG TPA: FtsX-like permease family protein [Thermoanaerobaculia bacterium]|nr:FtsX-like permease family protein [Thermoanaerobaculia bacterium]